MSRAVATREESPWDSRLQWLILGAVVLLAAALRFYRLGEDSLWIDEILTAVSFVKEPVFHIATHFHPNNHTFFSLLAHLATLGGTSDLMLRMPAAFLGVLAIPALYWLGRTVFGPTTGLLAAFLLAMSPYHIRFSQDARGYTGMVLFSLLSTICLFKAIESGRQGYIVGFVLTTALAIYTHLFATLLLGAELCILGAHLMARTLRKRDGRQIDLLSLRPWAIGLLVLALLLAVLFAPLWLALASVVDESLAGLYAGGLAFETDWGLDIASLELLVMRFGGSWASHGRIVAAVLFGFFGLGSAISLAKRDRLALCLISLLLMPFVAIILLLQLLEGFYVYSRFFVFMTPVYLLLASYGLTIAGRAVGELQGRWFRARSQIEEDTDSPRRDVRIGMSPRKWLAERRCLVYGSLSLTFLTFGAMEVASLEHYYAYERQDWRSAAQIIDAHVSPGDAVVSWREFCLAYYYPGDLQSIPWQDESDALRALRSVYNTYDRMWFVYPAGLPSRVDQGGSIRQWLEQEDFLLTRLPGIWLWFKRRSALPYEETQAEMTSLVEDVVRLNADNAPVLALLGSAYEDQDLPDFAIQAHEQALVLDSGLAGVWQNLGDILYEQGELERATDAFQQAARLEPEKARLFFRLCRTYRKLARGYEAAMLHACQRAAVLDPSEAWYRVLLGDAFVSNQLFEEALAEYGAASNLDPDYGDEAWYHLRVGDAYRLLGQLEEAMRAYRKALAIDPDDRQTQERLSELEP